MKRLLFDTHVSRARSTAEIDQEASWSHPEPSPRVVTEDDLPISSRHGY
jgi:hypothetical protein